MPTSAHNPGVPRLASAACALALGGAVAFGAGAPYAAAPSDPAAQARQGVPVGFADTIERVSPAVVNIRISRNGPRGAGSGFVVTPEGHIVTNHHVIEGADKISVTFADRTRLEASVVGTDPRTDLALLKVDADGPLAHVGFGDSAAVRVGDWAVALGNPFGLGLSATTGIISARGRRIGAGPSDDFLQISALINKGNSGGPTFNLEGEVIGVNTAIFSPNGGGVGIGFAIPSSLAKDVVSALREHGTVVRAWLGVRIQRIGDDLADSLGLPDSNGALVASIAPDGPAAGSDLRQGDVIVAVDDKPVDRMHTLPGTIGAMEPGSTANLTVVRDGEERDVPVTLGRLPEDGTAVAARTRLGIRLAEVDGKVRVMRVRPGSVAEEKGIEAGDMLLQVDRRPVANPAEVRKAIGRVRAAGRTTVLMLLERDGDPLFVALPLRKA